MSIKHTCRLDSGVAGQATSFHENTGVEIANESKLLVSFTILQIFVPSSHDIDIV